MDTYTALADPTRRHIIELLAGDDHDAGHIARQFDISRPAISRHLRVLREAGIISSQSVAQHRVYSLQQGAFDEMIDWMMRHRIFWTSRLDALAVRAITIDRENP